MRLWRKYRSREELGYRTCQSECTCVHEECLALLGIISFIIIFIVPRIPLAYRASMSMPAAMMACSSTSTAASCSCSIASQMLVLPASSVRLRLAHSEACGKEHELVFVLVGNVHLLAVLCKRGLDLLVRGEFNGGAAGLVFSHCIGAERFSQFPAPMGRRRPRGFVGAASTDDPVNSQWQAGRR